MTPQNFGGGRRPGQAVCDRNLAVLAVGRADPQLRVEGQRDGRQDDNVRRVPEEHTFTPTPQHCSTSRLKGTPARRAARIYAREAGASPGGGGEPSTAPVSSAWPRAYAPAVMRRPAAGWTS